MNSIRVLLASGALLILPMATIASGVTTDPRAGTDDYLRDKMGYTDEMLSEAIATEDREPFGIVEGETAVSDPVGDVLNRWGQSSDVGAGWADITNVALTHNTSANAWEFAVTMAEAIPSDFTEKAQLFILVDTDGNTETNEVEGMRIGTDGEFSLQHNEDAGWYTDFRWYNKDADFWATNKETTSSFSVNGNTILYRIPEAEITDADAFRWRVVMAVSNSDGTQIDSAHDIGFPPAKGGTVPTPEQTPETETADTFPLVETILVAVGLIAIGYSIWTVRRAE